MVSPSVTRTTRPVRVSACTDGSNINTRSNKKFGLIKGITLIHHLFFYSAYLECVYVNSAGESWVARNVSVQIEALFMAGTYIRIS